MQTTYSSSNNQISYVTVNGVNTYYTYDAAGSLLNDGTYSYQWDAEGRLTAVTLSGIVVSMNTYNALGQRVEDVTQASTTEEAYGALRNFHRASVHSPDAGAQAGGPGAARTVQSPAGMQGAERPKGPPQ